VNWTGPEQATLREDIITTDTIPLTAAMDIRALESIDDELVDLQMEFDL